MNPMAIAIKGTHTEVTIINIQDKQLSLNLVVISVSNIKFIFPSVVLFRQNLLSDSNASLIVSPLWQNGHSSSNAPLPQHWQETISSGEALINGHLGLIARPLS